MSWFRRRFPVVLAASAIFSTVVPGPVAHGCTRALDFGKRG